VLAPAIQCGKCKAWIPEESWNRETSCPLCHATLTVRTYPAKNRLAPAASIGAPLVTSDEAACFFHADKKAVVPCANCGRFLCGTCDCEIHGRHICPTCLDLGAGSGGTGSLVTRRVLYDNISLSLAALPILTVYLPVITAPTSIFFAIKYWKKPGSIVPRTKIRFIVAIVLSMIQILGIAAIIAAIAIFASTKITNG
jgi:hypothetical protein